MTNSATYLSPLHRMTYVPSHIIISSVAPHKESSRGEFAMCENRHEPHANKEVQTSPTPLPMFWQATFPCTKNFLSHFFYSLPPLWKLDVVHAEFNNNSMNKSLPTNLPPFVIASHRRRRWQHTRASGDSGRDCVDLSSRKLNTCRDRLCVDGCVCWIGLGIWIRPRASHSRKALAFASVT